MDGAYGVASPGQEPCSGATKMADRRDGMKWINERLLVSFKQYDDDHAIQLTAPNGAREAV